MKVISTTLPAESKLFSYVGQSDFLDCYMVASNLPAREAAEIVVQFPAWAQFLVRIRAIVTRPFGLDQTGPEAEDKLGFFPVETSSDSEVIAGFNDRHQDFRVSVMSKNGHVYLATWAHTHNIGGRIYLAMIMPFHILISRNALARVAKRKS